MLQFTTRDGSSSSGKAWVLLCALPEEAKAWLTTVSEDIFQFCNCAIWYDDGVDTAADDLESAIAQSALAVLPVTAALLDPDSSLQRHILPLLQRHRVSILPVLDDPNLLDSAIRILEGYEKIYPGQYIDTLGNALGNRAVLLLSQGRVESARADFDTAIRIFREASGRQMELAKALWNMAITYSMQADLAPARQYFREAVAIYESDAVQGSRHSPDFAQCCHNFANALCDGGAYAESLTWANRATEIYRGLQGSAGEAYASQIEDLRRLAEWLAQRI